MKFMGIFYFEFLQSGQIATAQCCSEQLAHLNATLDDEKTFSRQGC